MNEREQKRQQERADTYETLIRVMFEMWEQSGDPERYAMAVRLTAMSVATLASRGIKYEEARAVLREMEMALHQETV